MTDRDKPTQLTQPHDPDAEPIEIPVPTRDAVLRDLMKASPPAKPPEPPKGP